MSNPESLTHTPVELPFAYRAAARLRGLAWPAGPILILLGCGLVALAQVVELTTMLGIGVAVLGVVLLCLWSACSLFPGGPALPVATLAAPVVGRWRALNSPTSKKPSHGTHALGQTFALDLLHEPPGETKPEFPTAGAFLPPGEFPAFGAAVHAPASGTVVAVHDGARDHRSRTNWLSFGYLMIEGMLREFVGARAMLGNHVVIEGPDGYVVLAHLRRGSVEVSRGDEVRVGQQVAQCGNSGNSSEPHVHVQLADSSHLRSACGLPFRFDGTRDDAGAVLDDLPETGDAFVAD